MRRKLIISFGTVILFLLPWIVLISLNHADSRTILVRIIFFTFCFIWLNSGWKAMSNFHPTGISLLLPIIGGLVYFVEKAVISIIVGVFRTPYIISKNIADLFD